MKYDVIVDCYTDEPSGLGVPPFLSVHSRYIAGSLEEQKRKYYYLTIDDLRYSNGEKHNNDSNRVCRISINVLINKDNNSLSCNRVTRCFSLPFCLYLKFPSIFHLLMNTHTIQ